jgi:riboflavin synthase
MVTGLVEEVGRIASYTDHPEAARVGTRGRTVVPGARPGDSIAVDGVSPTVSGLAGDDDGHRLQVSPIPTTLRHTTLGAVSEGTPVDLGVDVIATYVDRLLSTSSAGGGTTSKADRA